MNGRTSAPPSEDSLGGALDPGPAFRLKPWVELFPASDGDVYVLRGGARSELVIRRPSARDRAVLAALGRGVARTPELAETVDQLQGVGLLEELDPAAAEVLSEADRVRFDRQLPYFADRAPGGGHAAQARLRAATVLVLGCGGLGCWTAAALACAGVGRFVLVDPDVVELSNLNRQVLYGESDLGQRKVDAAAKRLRGLDSSIECVPIPTAVASVEDVLAVLGRGVDVVVEAADTPPHRLARWVDTACLERRVPHISAAQAPPLLRVGPLMVPGVTACYCCQERAARRDHPLYDELVEFRATERAPATTLGPASGIVGAAMAMEVVNFVSGAAAPATLGGALLIDIVTGEQRLEAVARDPECPACVGLLPSSAALCTGVPE
ncbi:MAG: Dinucleotide-utilizing enzyme [Solirubrobacterales bacterium]|nr:Dinucleotide-utilizing enzyme [Solirubrobacterales bacterium]